MAACGSSSGIAVTTDARLRLLSAAPLSLGETLAALRARGARLQRTSTGVALLHGHRLGALADAVVRHHAALALWLDLGRSAVAPGLEAWDEGVRLQARWLAERFVPPPAFELRPGETVVDGPRYVRELLARLALGPEAPGSQRETLELLFTRFALGAARPAEPAFRRAA